MPIRIDLAVSAELQLAFSACNFAPSLAIIRPSDQQGVDFQCDAAIRLGKSTGTSGTDVAERIVSALPPGQAIRSAWVSGPGFINLVATDAAVIAGLGAAPDQAPPTRTIIDFGGPNVAKPLHVGHLRSLSIGESLRRLLLATGQDVVSDIHAGDFGLQMGLLVTMIEETYADEPHFDDQGLTEAAKNLTVDDLERLYPAASARSKNDQDFLSKARSATAALQAGSHAGYVALWHHMRAISLEDQMREISRLDARFDLLKGESDTAEHLDGMVAELLERGIAIQSDGAVVVEVAVPEDGKRPMPPLILKTRDGYYTYGATDLATIRERFGPMGADKAIYVTDLRQKDHFTQVGRAAAACGYAGAEQIVHVGFGTVNGPDGKPFRTRDGGTAKLSGLIDQAIAHVSGKSPDLDPSDVQAIAVGAVKFADLVMMRTAGYVFDIDKATATEGKTGVYLQYAAARIAAIIGSSEFDERAGLPTPAARALALAVARTPTAISAAVTRLQPHILANHGWEVAAAFNALYAETRILDPEQPERSGQLVWLCRQVRKELVAILDLLGIECPSRM